MRAREGAEFMGMEGGEGLAGGVLQTRHDKGKCTYECTPDWLRDGFHGDQFARPGEVVAAAATAATTVAQLLSPPTQLTPENCTASKRQKVVNNRYTYHSREIANARFSPGALKTRVGNKVISGSSST